MNLEQASWVGAEAERSGIATFHAGDDRHLVKFESFADYHMVCMLIERSYQRGYLHAVDACTRAVMQVKL